MITRDQIELCLKYGVTPQDSPDGLEAGVAANVQTRSVPLNGLRHPPQGDTTGWYIWSGEELLDDPEFFQPQHVRHLLEWRLDVQRYLALPPGWRFLVAPGYEDVWYDESLLNV